MYRMMLLSIVEKIVPSGQWMKTSMAPTEGTADSASMQRRASLMRRVRERTRVEWTDSQHGAQR